MANMCSSEGYEDTALAQRPLALLEREIIELAAQIHAATCRWLSLIGEYDARREWEWGFKSCAHWVSWQCGIAPGAAREHVRVARRLRELPLIRAAFARGELSYSKVRALTRINTVEREEDLLQMARHATASELDRIVRGYRRVVAAQRAAVGAPPERALWYEHDDDGNLLLYARLPAEEGALVLAALDAAGESLARADVPVGTPAAPEPDAGDVPVGTPVAPSTEANDVPAGTPTPSRRETRADALLAVADSYLVGERGCRSGAERHQVVVHVDTATLSTDGAGERCELADGEPLAPDTARRLACDASLVQLIERDAVPLKLGRKTRTISPALRRALAARDRHCRFPGCSARRFVDAHHIEHWADGGRTDLENLVQLCRRHHRLLHEGGYRITRPSSGRLVFSRRDVRQIARCPAGPHGPPAALDPTRPDACRPLSYGDPLNLGWAVEAMIDYAPICTSEPPGI
jgi:uncharacterized protein DUF222/HNH endonuclease